jgi:hypothetical protein
MLAIVHPDDEGSLYAGIADQANKWIFVHLGQLVLTPLIAVGVWMLLDGIESAAAQVARIALVVWMVFFSAFDAIAGIATGVLTRHANSLASDEREPVVGAINFLFDDSQLVGGSNFSILANVGQDSWIVLAIAATLWRAGLSRLIVAATLVSGLFAVHAGYVAAIGLVALFLAEVLRFATPSGEPVRSRAPSPA